MLLLSNPDSGPFLIGGCLVKSLRLHQALTPTAQPDLRELSDPPDLKPNSIFVAFGILWAAQMSVCSFHKIALS